jgi:hypothetical protein
MSKPVILENSEKKPLSRKGPGRLVFGLRLHPSLSHRLFNDRALT